MIHEKYIPVLIGAGVAAATLAVEKVVERVFSVEYVYEDEPEDDEPEEDTADDEASEAEEDTKEIRLLDVS
jgi:hypothetical protein